VLAQQVLRRFVHLISIERRVDPPRAMPVYCRALQAIQNAITIVTRRCRETSVKLVVDLTRPYDADVVRKIAVGAQQPAAIVAATGRIEMNDLSGGMDTGIGAAGAGDFKLVIGHRAQRFFDALLNAEACFLPLPAVIRSPVVLNAERNAHLIARLKS